MKALVPFFAILLFVLSCKGPEGDQGPLGPQGPAGAGTRVVYTGTVTTQATTATGQVISVPELDLADLPLVGVYVGDATGYIALNIVTSDGQNLYLNGAFLQTGYVTLFLPETDFVGLSYRIVVVT